MDPSSHASRHATPAYAGVPAEPRPRPRKTTPVDQLRARHCMEVVLALRDHPALSRVDLCRLLKRSPTTMTKVIAQLLGAGRVTESAVQHTQSAGRPRTILRLESASAQVLSIVVEPAAVHCAVVGLDMRVHHPSSHVLPVAAQDATRTLRELIRIVKAQNRLLLAAGESALQSVAIVVPGRTDTRLRTSLRAPLLGWKDLDIAGIMEPVLGIPVLVHNNTRAMAFAEFRHLQLHEDQPMLFVQARFGLGAAMVNSATPSHHGHYGVSELGHIPLYVNHFSDRIPTDANLVSVTNEAYLRAVLGLSAQAGDVLPLLEQRRDANDKLAIKLYAQTIENLAMGLGIAVNLLNPRIIVLGGIYGQASERFVQDLQLQLSHHANEELTQGLQLQCSQLGSDCALQGAAIIAFDRLLRDPATYHRPSQESL